MADDDYAVFEQAGASPALSDGPAIAAVDSNAPVGDHVLTITVQDDAATPNKLQAEVTITGASGTKYHKGQSKAPSDPAEPDDGQLAVPVSDGDYKILAVLDGYTTSPVPVTVSGADQAATVTMTQTSTPATGDPTKCTVYGDVIDGSGAAVTDAVFAFRPSGVGTLDDGLLLAVTDATATVTATGRVSKDLLRCVTYDMWARRTDATAFQRVGTINVPAAATYAIPPHLLRLATQVLVF